MSSVYEQYRQTAVQTAPPEQLVIMLYDGAVRFLEQAKAALQEGNDAGTPIGRAQDIIIELTSSLNKTAGGEIAENLGRLYDFWIQWLLQAQLRKEVAKVEEVLVMVRELREAWVTIAQQKRAAATGTQASAINARG